MVTEQVTEQPNKGRGTREVDKGGDVWLLPNKPEKGPTGPDSTQLTQSGASMLFCHKWRKGLMTTAISVGPPVPVSTEEPMLKQSVCSWKKGTQ